MIKKLIPKALFKALIPYWHYLQAVLANVVYFFPMRHMKVIGVTGTDGKTTTTSMISQLLSSAGYKVASISTVSVDYGDGKGERPNPSHMTTASSWTLMKMFKKIRPGKPDWVVLEVSSHALAQHRVRFVPFEIAVITNITHEHLDYHGTFENYLAAKRKLFDLTARRLNGLQAGVINADDPNAEVFQNAVANSVTYGINNGDLKAVQIKLTSSSSQFVVKNESGEYRLKCPMPGRFNIYNSLAAVTVGWILDLNKNQIEKGIAGLHGVAGRMSRIESGQDFDVIIDYAVTPAALENVLKTTRETTKGKVMIVFGATGDRDKEKRPDMGSIAAELADRIFLTDDETYTEDPDKIRQAVYEGIEKAKGAAKTLVFKDRGDAIRAALSEAKKGDTVLITGLGHQTDRNMGGIRRPWSDEKAVRKVLQH